MLSGGLVTIIVAIIVASALLRPFTKRWIRALYASRVSIDDPGLFNALIAYCENQSWKEILTEVVIETTAVLVALFSISRALNLPLPRWVVVVITYLLITNAMRLGQAYWCIRNKLPRFLFNVGHCQQCGYDLEFGATTCPECGRDSSQDWEPGWEAVPVSNQADHAAELVKAGFITHAIRFLEHARNADYFTVAKHILRASKADDEHDLETFRREIEAAAKLPPHSVEEWDGDEGMDRTEEDEE